jgi:two-component system, OmpR family, KDP operon response regulator KdpE
MARNVGKVLTFMATLRKKLESAPGAPQQIQTHIGVGYRMLRL